MLVDSHAHLNFEAFDDDWEQVIGRVRQKQMKVINVGSQLSTSRRAIELAEQFDCLSAAVGIHPIHLGDYRRDSQESAAHHDLVSQDAKRAFEQIAALAERPQVVAIGETGLDYFRLSGDIAAVKVKQREYFLRHLSLARDRQLPVILHCRGQADDPLAAYDEILDILRQQPASGVIHCFGANWPVAEKFLSLGFYIGFTGIITFGKKAGALELVAKNTPLDRILIETDCPYLAPEPHRGERNEPIYVELVAQKIAEFKRLPVSQVIEQTGENAINLFNISR